MAKEKKKGFVLRALDTVEHVGNASAQPCNDFPDFDGSCNRTVRNLCGLWCIGYI